MRLQREGWRTRGLRVPRGGADQIRDPASGQPGSTGQDWLPAQAPRRAASERGAPVSCQFHLSSGKLDQATPGTPLISVGIDCDPEAGLYFEEEFNQQQLAKSGANQRLVDLVFDIERLRTLYQLSWNLFNKGMDDVRATTWLYAICHRPGEPRRLDNALALMVDARLDAGCEPSTVTASSTAISTRGLIRNLPGLRFVAEPRGDIGYRPDCGIVEAALKADT